jgi:hypothetical protein
VTAERFPALAQLIDDGGFGPEDPWGSFDSGLGTILDGLQLSINR